MAKINKIKKNGALIYPLTIPQAVKDPTTGKTVAELLGGKQDTLVSGTNIKTVNGESLLVPGDISVVNGADGDSAYQIWLDAGNVGTQADFLASLQGNSGYSGAEDELEVVNNLTDGGATSALSAEMGKDLNGRVASNAEEIDNLYGITGYVTKSVTVTRSGVSISFPYTCPANTKLSLTLVADGVLNTEVNMSLYANTTSNQLSSTFQVGVTKVLTPTMEVTKFLLWISTTAFIAAGTVQLLIGRANNLSDRTTAAEDNIGSLEQRVIKRLEGTSASGGTSFAYPIKAGKSYIISNTGANSCTFSSRNTSSGSTVESLATIMAGGVTTVTATENAKYIRAGQETTFTVDCVDSLDYALGNIESEMASVNGLKNEATVSSNTDGATRFHFVPGHKYKIVNSGNNVTLSTRNTVSGSTVESIGSVAAGATKIFEPTLEAFYLRYGGAASLTVLDASSVDGRLKDLEGHTSAEMENRLVVTDTALYHKYNIVAGHKYLIKNTGTNALTFTTWNATTGADADKVDSIGSVFGNGASYNFIASADAKYIKTGGPGQFTITDCSLTLPTVDLVNDSLVPMLTPPMVDLTVDYEMKDVSSDIAGLDFTATDSLGCRTIMDQIYAKFDSLVAGYSGYVSKVDAAEEVELDYPDYATLEGAASGDYLATPSYRVYMYKLIDSNSFVHRTMHPKHKIFIVGGTHGEESVAPVNLYLFAKRLCEAADNNYFNLRSAFDFYIIPCLNGYGMYHNTRQNGNQVDVNRNFPTRNWAEQDSGQRTYTGPTAGSEFETQLVVAQTGLINPELAIDHHNYAALDRQFYASVATYNLSRVIFQALADCSYTFIKNMPEYFGTSYKLFQNATLSAPGYLAEESKATMALWWYQNGIACPATVEVSQCINYHNGEYSGMYVNRGPDTLSIAEYTLRDIIIRFCQWLGKYHQSEKMKLIK